jgi:hypothetical protein
MPVRRWAATGRDVHVDKAKPSRCVLAGQKSCVRVANESDVR